MLAILTLKPDANPDAVRSEIAHEIRGSWTLYASGTLREVYATELPTRVVFVMEAANVADAEHHLQPLPLVQAGMFQIEFLELRPFANWSTLFRADQDF